MSLLYSLIITKPLPIPPLQSWTMVWNTFLKKLKAVWALAPISLIRCCWVAWIQRDFLTAQKNQQVLFGREILAYPDKINMLCCAAGRDAQVAQIWEQHWSCHVGKKDLETSISSCGSSTHHDLSQLLRSHNYLLYLSGMLCIEHVGQTQLQLFQWQQKIWAASHTF